MWTERKLGLALQDSGVRRGNPSPWPYANETDPSIGQPCPYGYYCPAGKFQYICFGIKFDKQSIQSKYS